MSGEDPFAQFKAVFFEECSELLGNMEQCLGDLQEGATDNETLNAIFRAVHSIKAGAGSFQYTNLVTFSHIFEALLDKLRSGEIDISDDVVELLFSASDVLADLVGAAQEGKDLGAAYGEEIRQALEDRLQGGGGAVPAKKPAAAAPKEAAKPAAPAEKVYKIDFQPKPELFRHANEPLLIIRELGSLGSLTVTPDYSALPGIHDIEPEDAYISWKLELRGDATRDQVDEVFEFVETDCDLTIVEDSGDAVADTADAAADSEAVDDVLEHDESEGPEQASPEKQAEIAAAVAKANEGKAPVGAATAPAATQKTSSIRVDLDRLDRLVNMVGELVITQAMLTQEVERLEGAATGALLSGMEEMAAYARELQESVMAVRMQPVKSVFARMPRLVRDLSAKLGKKIKLETSGEATEVDKTVIEELADPLTHMIRNSLDHGIESPEDREKAGKPAQGTIWLSAEHRGGRILIEVSDDGRGINRERVLQKAKERGLLDKESLTNEEIDNLIFHPGFSTAEKVTDVSGRGVGMDVVRRNIMSLGGRISVQSETGKGSRFTLALPLTLAVLDGMIVAVGDQKYVIPVNSITESIRPNPEDVMPLMGGTRVVKVRGEYIPLISLAHNFGVSGAIEDPSKALVVIVEMDSGSTAGLVVDHLIGQQQVVIKSLEQNYRHVAGIGAATILGNGQVCLIVDIDGLESMERRTRGGRKMTSEQIENALAKASNNAGAA